MCISIYIRVSIYTEQTEGLKGGFKEWVGDGMGVWVGGGTGGRYVRYGWMGGRYVRARGE